MQAPSRNERNQAVIREFRANKGKLGGGFAGRTVLLLTTKGAKSGKPHTTPVMYMKDGDRVVVFASKGGGPTNPDWYHNLLANPDATVEVGEETYPVHATVVTGEERNRLYARHASVYTQFADYEKNTKRLIPVVALVRKR